MHATLKKLRGRSLEELRVRGMQALAAGMERSRLSSQTRVHSEDALFRLLNASRAGRPLDSAESVREHFRTRTAPYFFASFADRAGTLAHWRQRFKPAAQAQVIARADRIVAGEFDLLGRTNLQFGDPIDWHREPVLDKRAPLCHWSRIDYLDPNVAGDKKYLWELNRHQYFTLLGRAYWLTGEERYAQVCIAHLNAWMEQNPPKWGINWAGSLEVAFRAISWLWALAFFKDSPHLSAPVLTRMLRFLYLHARHLETYPSTYFSPNTHLTGEALGLFYLGTLLPEFRRAAHWRRLGRQILTAQLDRQVHSDGVYFEQAAYYHRYTVDFYTHLLLLQKANGEPLDANLSVKLTAMLDHLTAITRPDGTTPLFGDDDGGRLVILDERAPNDFRAALSTGAVLFGRGDYKYAAQEAAEETLWLLGVQGMRRFDSLEACPPAHASAAFPQGGYYVLRDGRHRDANFMLLDCGPHGVFNGGHAHADALALDLAVCGRTLLVDSGTYTYTGSTTLRDLFRTSAAHNTLTIDGESSSVPSGPFSWRHIAQTRAQAWISRERFDYFEGSHDGYARLDPPAIHTRSVLFLKGDYWIVRDRVETTGTHRCDLHFHFTPDARPVVEMREGVTAVCTTDEEDAGLAICTFGEGGAWHLQEGLVSRSYGELSPAPTAVFSRTAEGAQEFLTFLVPQRGQDRARVREMEAIGGRAFDMQNGQARDLLLLGNGSRMEAGRFASDFDFAWVRFAPDDTEVNEFVLCGGQCLFIDGRKVIGAREQIGYLTAYRTGETLHVDTDASGDFSLASLGASRLIRNGDALAVRPGAIVRFVRGRGIVTDIPEPEATSA